jgi:PEP-CTERM motif
MKNKLFLSILAILLTMAISVGTANANTIFNFGSHPSVANTLTDVITSPSGDVIAIGNNPAWYGPLYGSVWVGVGQTGDPSRPGWVEMPNGTVTDFSDSFTLPENFVVSSATLSVLVDDTATGWVNGVKVFDPDFTLGNACSSGAPGCLSSTLWTGDVTTLVRGGKNLLQLDVLQLGGSSTGADWKLTVTGGNTAPEPASLIVFGTGIVFISFLRWRRRNMK